MINASIIGDTVQAIFLAGVIVAVVVIGFVWLVVGRGK